MAMVDVDGVANFRLDWLGLGVGGHPELSLHSSDGPGELSQRLCS